MKERKGGDPVNIPHYWLRFSSHLIPLWIIGRGRKRKVIFELWRDETPAKKNNILNRKPG